MSQNLKKNHLERQKQKSDIQCVIRKKWEQNKHVIENLQYITKFINKDYLSQTHEIKRPETMMTANDAEF